MEQKDWFKETAFAVTICDTNGIVVYMNEKSEKLSRNRQRGFEKAFWLPLRQIGFENKGVNCHQRNQ